MNTNKNKYQSYTVCYHDKFTGNGKYIETSWECDNRGGPRRNCDNGGYDEIVNVSDKYNTSFIRHINPVSEGLLQCDFSFTVSGIGAQVSLTDEKEESGVSFTLTEKGWLLCSEEVVFPVEVKQNTAFSFRLLLDLDNGECKTYINEEYCGISKLKKLTLARFFFTALAKSYVTIVPHRINIVANYASYEDFSFGGLCGNFGWTRLENARLCDNELVFDGKGCAKKEFSAVNMNYCAELMFFQPKEDAEFSFTLYDTQNRAFVISSKDGRLFADGKEAASLVKNLWHRLRIEVDVEKKTARVLLNGRERIVCDISTCDINAYSIENIMGNARFDCIIISNNPQYEDYVPEPLYKACDHEYLVGINVCPLWREGTHFGWSRIAPFPEAEPLLGYYEEGVPETADWEIKYLLEHGVTFQAFCWYNSETDKPIKKPMLSYHVHNGYQYAKYSHYSKYAIMWEAGCCVPFDYEQFVENIVPYWFENYFLDDRYLKIDNKIVIFSWGTMGLVKETRFGSEEKTKQALEYVQNVAKQYGFDGCIFVYCGSPNSKMKQYGFEACSSYHHGAYGYSPNMNINCIDRNGRFNDIVYNIPTVSVGYNEFPWRKNRQPNMTPEDYKYAQTWVRDEYLPKHTKKGDWNDKLVMLSTWNEFGEGTYMFPTKLCGFGYLDAIRSVYTDFPEKHDDIIPNEAQKKRITHMYDSDFSFLRRQGYDELYNTCDLETVAKWNAVTDAVYTDQILEGQIKDGGLYGTAPCDIPISDSKIVFDGNGEDIANVTHVRFTIDVKAGTTVDFYYTTDKEPEFAINRHFCFQTDSDGKKTYTLKIVSGPRWGKLKQLRFDPTSWHGERFGVWEVELLTRKPQKYLLYCDEDFVDTKLSPDERDGLVLFPFSPETGFCYMLGGFYRWDKHKNVLTLVANDKTLVFTIGKDFFTVDGKEIKLDYELYLKDGLPMLNMKQLAECLGYGYETDGRICRIVTK